MAKIRKIEQKTPVLVRRKRVAAYARVSKDTERLMHSVSAQVSYYSKLIQGNPEWEYAGVYADSGISGTGIEKRDEFRRMLADCENGKIDIVLTKSISRFARNTVDLLTTVRHLKELGIEVRFEKEHIHSFSGDGELMLSILASFAQEEVRSISDNVKWGVRKTYQQGMDGVRNKKVMGYRYDEQSEQYIIEPTEAKIVQFIFQSVLKNTPANELLRQLKQMDAKTCLGYDFSYGTLYNLLRNEIYMGDRRLQKSFIENPITHNKIKNRGQLPQYYISDCHEPIIDRDMFEKVQKILQQRADAVPTYCFTKKIRCGICGRMFSRNKGKPNRRTYWICRAKKEKGITCTSCNFEEEKLKQICAEVLGIDAFDEDLFGQTVSEILVQKDGSLLFQFYDGGTALWQEEM